MGALLVFFAFVAGAGAIIVLEFLGLLALGQSVGDYVSRLFTGGM